MKRSTPLLFALIGIVVWFAGCSVTDEGTPYPNQAPVTVLTYVPLGGDTINHYVTLYWSATDEDGDVVAFRVRVDDHAPVITTRHDTTIGFPAPIDSEVVYHTFAVSAIDNEGLEGPAASDSFYTINFVPTVAFDPDGSVPNGANVGTGFRVTVESADPNPSTLQYCLRLDDSTWNDGAGWNCSPNFVFLFASSVLHERPTDLTVVNEDDDGDGRIDEERENGADDDGDGAIDEDTQGLFPENTAIVPNAGLTPGAHTIYARVIDAGGAVSPAAMRNVTVLANQVPTMDTTTTGTYGGDNVYPDGSVYFAQNVETQLTFSANAAIYRGEINAYRYTVMAVSGSNRRNSRSKIWMSAITPFALLRGTLQARSRIPSPISCTLSSST